MRFKTLIKSFGRLLELKLNRVGKPKLISSQINELGETISIFETKRIIGKPHITKTIEKELCEQDINPEFLEFLS